MNLPPIVGESEFYTHDLHAILGKLMAADTGAGEAIILTERYNPSSAESGGESYTERQPVSNIRGVWWHPDRDEVVEGKDIQPSLDYRGAGYVPAFILE